MRILVEQTPLPEITADALVVIGYEKNGEALELSGPARAADEATGGWIRETYESGGFKGKLNDTALLHRPAGLGAKRLLLVGGGKAGKFTPAELRWVAGTAVRHLKPKYTPAIALALDGAIAGSDYVRAAVEGAVLGDFEPDKHKTERDPKKSVELFSVAVPAVNGEREAAARFGQIVAESQNFARELAGEPANLLTPLLLADRARQLAREQGLDCEILERDRMQQLGMGALLGVAQGSTEPPALIILRYQPPAQPPSGAHLGLVGKGVTFDSGGISIKPAEGMEKMKYDMSGGAAVLGAMRALAQLKPPIPVTALIPAVENMVSGRAQRPGDIVKTLAGKTVEVLNTDAEGRLILIDALAYARRLGCTHLVDAATLTGAIVIALGYVNVGVFTNDDNLLERLMGSAKAAGEKMWHMPLDDEYKDLLKSAFADLPNIGGRWGGAISAAMFLREFVEDTPWVHLDIAGTAWLEEEKPFLAKGASGVGVRTMVDLAMNWRD